MTAKQVLSSLDLATVKKPDLAMIINSRLSYISTCFQAMTCLQVMRCVAFVLTCLHMHVMSPIREHWRCAVKAPLEGASPVVLFDEKIVAHIALPPPSTRRAPINTTAMQTTSWLINGDKKRERARLRWKINR
jgi:hypothetical protein